MDEKDKVDRLEHDKVMMYLNHNNRRMFLAVLIVCITFALVIVAYTIREKNWLDTMANMYTTPVVTEAPNGIQQSVYP